MQNNIIGKKKAKTQEMCYKNYYIAIKDASVIQCVISI